jgi:hypothetical protein
MKRLIALVLLCLPLAALADERILSFHSDVRVMADGMIEVTESIKVRAEGQQIRRGIYRDFPVDYEDRLGNASSSMAYTPTSFATVPIAFLGSSSSTTSSTGT